MPVIECDPDIAERKLREAGAAIEDGNTNHERWRAAFGDAIAVAYEDKIVIQGSDPYRITSVIQSNSGRCHLYFDGASRGNPGRAAAGWVLISDDGIVAEDGKRIGHATNNQAEYAALLDGVKKAVSYGFDEIHIRGDSELIVKQIRGEWKTNDPKLQEYRVRIYEYLDKFDTWEISHIPRELNERADKLANKALDE